MWPGCLAGAFAHHKTRLELHAQRLVGVPVELAHQHRDGGAAHLLQRLALGAGLPVVPAAGAGEGVAARKAGHPRKGWPRTVRVSRRSDRGLDHGSDQRLNVTLAGLA